MKMNAHRLAGAVVALGLMFVLPGLASAATLEIESEGPSVAAGTSNLAPLPILVKFNGKPVTTGVTFSVQGLTLQCGGVTQAAPAQAAANYFLIWVKPAYYAGVCNGLWSKGKIVTLIKATYTTAGGTTYQDDTMTAIEAQ